MNAICISCELCLRFKLRTMFAMPWSFNSIESHMDLIPTIPS